MKGRLPAPAMRLFRGETRIFVPPFIEELVRTIRQVAPREGRNGIEYLTEFRFRSLDFVERTSERLLRSLAFNGDARDVGKLLDDALIERSGLCRLVVVERERAEDLATRGRDRR